MKTISYVMKNSSSCEFECKRKTLSRSRNHYVSTRLSERGETRHAHYRRAIYRESRCGNIAMKRRLGDLVHEWERRREREHDFLLRDASRDAYTKRRHAREKSPSFSSYRSRRVTNESRSKHIISPPLSLPFCAPPNVSFREYKY